jgi:hypothetical protein
MLNPTSLLADALGRNLAETYRRIYGDQEPHIASGLDEAARLVIERIASSDALYHDCEHTAPSPFASRTFCAAVASSGSSRPAIGRIRFWPR